MFFASDNAGPVPQQVMDVIAAANTGWQMPYGADDLNADVVTRLRDIFEAPEAAIYLVPTGTAANSLALACYCQPYQTIYCSPVAHIHEDECGAPEFYAGGAKLTLVGSGEKMSPVDLKDALSATAQGVVHGVQRGPVSITQVTEKGTLYSLTELSALCEVAKSFDAPVHLDGARFANAVVALGCTPAEMTWKAGVDVVSFGGTKNGLMGVEAVIFFDPSKAWEFELRRKRAAHLFSKHRYLSAQMAGYLKDDLWLDLATRANANCTRLTKGLRDAGAAFLYEPQANMIFAQLPRAAHRRLKDAGAAYYLMGTLEGPDEAEMLTCRLVCDWSITDDLIDQFIALAKG